MKHLIFSGHETFACKTLWLKKGYDFVINHGDFKASDAVSKLGVGKNMVGSIRFWLKVFGITIDDQPTELGKCLFSDEGWDPYCEDIATLWLLHYVLVSSCQATIYHIAFTDMKRTRLDFTRKDLSEYIKIVCEKDCQSKAYNEKTVAKDIGVLLQNYVYPTKVKSLEEYSNLLIDLKMIQENGTVIGTNGKREIVYRFCSKNPKEMIPEVVFYALRDSLGDEKILSYDKLSNIALIFGLTIYDLKIILHDLERKFPNKLSFTDNSGIMNVSFNEDVKKYDILQNYYSGR